MLVPLFIILGKLLTFLFNALLGSLYGAGKVSDVFIMAHAIPTILYEGIAVAFISCYIPIFSDIKHENPQALVRFNSNITTISTLLALLVTVVFLIFHVPVNRLYANGFDEEALVLLNRYSSILVWSIPFIGAYSIFRAYLQVTDGKALSSLGQIINYGLLILSMVMFYPHAESLAWATIAGNVACFGVFLAYAVRNKFRYHFYLSFREEYIKTIIRMIIPIFLSTLVSELASMIDKSFASRYADGIITCLTYGYQLSFALQGIVSTSLLIIVFPTMADKAAQKDTAGMNGVVYQCIELIAWVIAPLIIGGVVLAQPLIHLLFGHGRFSAEHVSITAVVFSGYMAGVFPMCVKHVGDRFCFALKKTNYAMMTTMVTVITNVVLDFLMSKIWGYMGLVAATGLSITTGCVTIYILIKRTQPDLKIRNIISNMVRPFALALMMGVVVHLVEQSGLASGMVGAPWNLVVDILLGGMVYLGLAMLLYRNRITALLRQR